MQASDGKESSPAVARARALDADGRHDDAINELALAAQRKDVDATTQLAKRIIVGDRAPRLTRQGIGLLRDAVNLGGAEAAGHLAVLYVAGMIGKPDWGKALRLLAQAVERGWAPARGQFEVLASMTGALAGESQTGRSLIGMCSGSPDAGIDPDILGRLLTPGDGEVLSPDPHVHRFPGFVSAEVCDWLIERAQGRLQRALVYDVVRQADVAGKTRTNTAAPFHIMDADIVHLLVQTRIAAACGQPVAHMEAPTVLHYGVGESIGNHYDFVDPEQPGYAEEIRTRGTRVLTFLVYLNSDYEGGETVFPKLDLTHAGQRGEGMFFVNTLANGQADVRTLHNGKPPTRGEKWIFSQFVRNRPDPIVE